MGTTEGPWSPQKSGALVLNPAKNIYHILLLYRNVPLAQYCDPKLQLPVEI